jgi:hypothetical protein
MCYKNHTIVVVMIASAEFNFYSFCDERIIDNVSSTMSRCKSTATFHRRVFSSQSSLTGNQSSSSSLHPGSCFWSRDRVSERGRSRSFYEKFILSRCTAETVSAKSWYAPSCSQREVQIRNIRSYVASFLVTCMIVNLLFPTHCSNISEDNLSTTSDPVIGKLRDNTFNPHPSDIALCILNFQPGKWIEFKRVRTRGSISKS